MSEGKKDGSVGKAIFGALGVLTGAGLVYTTYKLAQENNKLVNDYNDLAEQLDRLQTIDDSSISLNSLIAKWLGIDTNSKFTTGLKISDNNATDEKTLNIYKQFVNIFASAILNTKYDSIEDLNS